MDIDKLLKEMEDEVNNWPWYKNVWFEITYFFRNISSNWYSMIQGFKNFIKYRSLIWNDRWYDHTFLHQMLRFKLNDMAEEWKDAHYVGCEYEEKILQELVQILDKIEYLEDNWTTDSYNNIDNLYQEFGIKLFSIQKLHKTNKEFCKGEDTTTTTNFQRLWD